MLHQITGDAEFCVPCALSALTGLSSDTWPDEGMEKELEIEKYLMANFRIEDGIRPLSRLELISPELSRVMLGDFPDSDLVIKKHGTWLLVINYLNEKKETILHAVAVSIRPHDDKSKVERFLADNGHKTPISFSELPEHYLQALVSNSYVLSDA